MTHARGGVKNSHFTTHRNVFKWPTVILRFRRAREVRIHAMPVLYTSVSARDFNYQTAHSYS